MNGNPLADPLGRIYRFKKIVRLDLILTVTVYLIRLNRSNADSAVKHSMYLMATVVVIFRTTFKNER